ncbi:RecX family transcriptional regulator [Tistrella sp. BH-R2-4]|uniref:Regulatory protein RecX n=1 Tax=Tistrella arctica TaxID=3133430 RepID=A0ABU9YDF2_9PROT
MTGADHGADDGSRGGDAAPDLTAHSRLLNRLVASITASAGRHPASRADLERRARNRLTRWPEAGDLAPDVAAALIARALDKAATAGLVDDDAYARLRARSLRNRGRPRAGIARDLSLRGLAPERIETTLSDMAEDEGGADDRLGAIAYARRRRLGPWRPEGARDAMRQRDIAAMARAGYFPDLARRVIDAVEPAELDAWAADPDDLPERRRPGSGDRD